MFICFAALFGTGAFNLALALLASVVNIKSPSFFKQNLSTYLKKSLNLVQ